MSYPPSWRVIEDTSFAVELMRAHPFAHLFSAHNGLNATRAPFIADCEDCAPVRLRAHLNRQNPQVAALDGAPVLVTFSGPSSYVSPHWRANKTRGGTFDFEQATVRGTARVIDDIDWFRSLIDDLSALIEPQYGEVGDYPVWNRSMAVEGYIERLFPAVTAFEVEIEHIQTISKLHQSFPEEDRRSVAEHLARSEREDAQAIAAKIRKTLDD